ncbi:fibronectin type III domain-containing protein [Syntrophothermus lipocalidus]
MQWVILEQMPNGETYILLKDKIGAMAFDPNNTILFDPNDTNNIAYYLNNTFYNSLSQKDLIAEHSWDRLSVKASDKPDGTDFGNITCKVGLISFREYQRYLNIIPSMSNVIWWWTRTPVSYDYDNNHVWVVINADKTLSIAYANYYDNLGRGIIRPALYLKSGTVIDRNKVVIGVAGTPPVPPVGISASVESSTSVNISWQANTEADLAGYKIYRNNTEIANVDKTVTRYNDITVAPGITYTYEITAYNTSNLESARSSPITVTTPPATPTGVTGQATGRNITLTWQGPGNPQYIIERSNDGISFTQVAEVTQASFTETAPLWGTTYYYRVAQKGQDGTISAFSDPVQVMTDPVPVPSNLTAVLDGKNVKLSWQSANGINDYIVERSTDNITWSSLANVSNATSYTDEVTDPNTTYYYRVRSDGGNGQLSEPSNTAVITTPPAAPTGLTATAAGRNISLTWSGSAGAASYVIQRSTDGASFSQIAEVTVTSYLDSALDWNTTYYYRVFAKSESGLLSSPSNTAQVKTAPAPPANLRASVYYNNVTLTWDSSAGAESYTIQRSLDGDEWAEVCTTSETSYTDESLGWGITFRYRVTAKSADGLVSEPSAVMATTENVPAPSNLTARLEGTDVTLSWQAAPHVNMYLIERSMDGQTWEFLVEISHITTYTDTGLNLSNDYYYRVRSDGGNQISGPSNVVKVTMPPAAPTDLQASVNGKSVTLSWTGSANASYIVERSTDGSVWEQVAEVPETETTYQDTAPRWETTYNYRVLAKNSGGMISEPSESVQATTSAIPVPQNLKASVSGNAITVKWDAVAGIGQYKVERSVDGASWREVTLTDENYFTDNDLEWETTYYYRVRSMDSDQESDPSQPVSVKTAQKPIPAAPRLAFSVDNTRIGVSWNYQNVTGYRIYVDGKLVEELPGSSVNYAFEGEPGETYEISVEAYNAYGEASSTITVTVGRLRGPGAATMARDLAETTTVVIGSMGGLLALALGIKGSGMLMGILRLIIGR